MLHGVCCIMYLISKDYLKDEDTIKPKSFFFLVINEGRVCATIEIT